MSNSISQAKAAGYSDYENGSMCNPDRHGFEGMEAEAYLEGYADAKAYCPYWEWGSAHNHNQGAFQMCFGKYESSIPDSEVPDF